MNPSQQTSLQVLDTIDLLVRHWNRGDVPGILSHADPACSGYGPGPDRQFRGLEEFRIFLERETRQLQGLELSDLNVDAIGTISWVSAIFSSHRRGDIPPLQGRLTAVLKGTGHAWVLVHLHLSYPSLSPEKNT